MFESAEDWFRSCDFAGCPLIRTVLEAAPGTPIHAAAAEALGSGRQLVWRFAAELGLADPDGFAKAWHALLKGSIVAAVEGDRGATKSVRRAAALLLEAWPRLERI